MTRAQYKLLLLIEAREPSGKQLAPMTLTVFGKQFDPRTLACLFAKGYIERVYLSGPIWVTRKGEAALVEELTK